MAELSGPLLEIRRVAAADGDSGTQLTQAACDGQTEAGRATCDDRDSIFEQRRTEHHDRLPGGAPGVHDEMLKS
jgi:hypothetical protein